MECMRLMQQPGPRRAGWSLQHLSRPTGGRPAARPAGARSYDPVRWPHTTQTNINRCSTTFSSQGNKNYLARIPEAIAWLKSCPLPADAATRTRYSPGAARPTFIELGNQRRAVHAPLRLQHPQRRLLRRQGLHQHHQPLLGGPCHQHCGDGGHLQQAQRDDERRDCSHGREVTA